MTHQARVARSGRAEVIQKAGTTDQDAGLLAQGPPQAWQVTGQAGQSPRQLCAAAIALAIWAVWTFWVAAHHEPWRDEAQDWLLTLGRSPSEYLPDLRREGHPPLWYLMLSCLQAFQLPVGAKAVAEWTGAAAAAALLLWRSPLGMVTLALPFGYLFGYEYPVLARPYGWTVACLLGAYHAGRTGRFAAESLCLAGAALLSAYGALLAPFVLALRLTSAGGPLNGQRRSWPGRAPVAILVLAILVALTITRAPPDGRYPHDAVLSFDLQRLLSTAAALNSGLLPLPQGLFCGLPCAEWDWQRFSDAPTYRLFSLLVIPVALVALRLKHAPSAWIFCLAALSVAGFGYVFNAGYPRHWGFVWIAFLICYMHATGHQAPADSRGVSRAHQAAHGILIFLTLWTAAIGLATGLQEVSGLFSNAPAAAAWLKANAPADAAVYTDNDAKASAVISQSGRGPMFAGNGSRWNTYVAWDRKRLAVTSEIPSGIQWALMTESAAAPPGFTRIASFDRPSATGENYWIYKRSDQGKVCKGKAPAANCAGLVDY